MNYSVDYTYLHRGTIHVDAKSKKEAAAIVKEMWDIDVDRVYINADEEHVDENTFKVVDVQPEYEDKEEEE